MIKSVDVVRRKYTILHIISDIMKVGELTEAQQIDTALSNGHTLRVDESYGRQFFICIRGHVCVITPNTANVDRPKLVA